MHLRKNVIVVGALVLGGISLALHAQPSARESKVLRSSTLDKTRTSLVKPMAGQGGVINAPKIEVPPRVEAPDANKILIRRVLFEGDVSTLNSLGLKNSLTDHLQGKEMSGEAIEHTIKAYNNWFIKQGYYLAKITEEYDDIEKGDLLLVVDMGRVGTVSFFEMDKDYGDTEPEDRKELRKPYSGHFSQAQLRRKLRNVESGHPFNYTELHGNLFAINAHPDLILNTDLNVRRENNEAGLPTRFVDMDLYVDDRLPFHAVLEVKNTGTDATDEERAELTIQHLNLTKHDDALTITVPVSLDFETLRGFSSSYLVPHYLGKGGGVSVYGGYSELAVDDVVDQVNLDGDGTFVGARTFYRLIQTPDHSLNTALGVTYSSLRDTLISGGDTLDSEVEILPMSAGLIYQTGRLDKWRGRNFIAALVTYNLGDAAGITKEADVLTQREDSSPDYAYYQLQYSRIQSIGGQLDPNSGEYQGAWFGYFNLDGQYAPDPLIPSEQKVAGGFESVRGYDERPVSGEQGITGKVELRTPIYRGLLARALSSGKGAEAKLKKSVDYVQFDAFFDFGYVKQLGTTSLPSRDATLASIGAGFRFSFLENTQIKVDYGYPLEDLPGSSSNGRLHWAFEAQF